MNARGPNARTPGLPHAAGNRLRPAAHRSLIAAHCCFTLIELLVVVAIIGILAALLMPALSGVRERAKQIACMSQLKQWGVALTTYTSDNEGIYPPGEKGHGHGVYSGIAPYLGGLNLTTATRDKFWRQWVICPSKRNTRQEDVSYIALPSGSVVDGNYMYWGGNGDPDPGGPAITGTYAEYGWYANRFFNGHAPTPMTYGALWPSDLSSRVLMCDQGIYDDSSGSRTAMINPTAKAYPSQDLIVWSNHGWQKLQCYGINLLYVDGHVSWKSSPWRGGSNYWNGGFGPMDW
jgi:prepilin-type N-terminal cleavage/methylation domain-containing protein/prepilin-type processing-associated H-X9-DG protein